MKQLLTRLLCALFLHRFSTINSTEDTEITTCTRCHEVWHVDKKRWTMERVEKGVHA